MSDYSTKTGFGRFKVITGFANWCSHHNEFHAKMHHTTFYAKNIEVAKFMMALKRVKSGQICSVESSDVLDKQLFSDQ